MSSINISQNIVLSSELKFDAVVASEVIEHVDNPQLFIQTISGLLKVLSQYFVYEILGIDSTLDST